MSHVLILGGDGYLGWPTAMSFSSRGYQVTVVDNYFRRNACTELEVGMLYSVPTLTERAKIWHSQTGYEIKVVIEDLSEPDLMRQLFDGRIKYDWAIDSKFSGLPDTVIHYAEQPSAPYSMMGHQYADFTLINNLRVTSNILWAIRDYSNDTHLIKLGTMGEYGTPNIDIEEGWLEIEHKGRKDKFLYPRQASSLYHTSKIMDTDLIWFCVRMWGLRVTDLMQGPVYGIETKESLIDPRLRTIFNYDKIFGTVVNRFITQAVMDYPLTIYGAGGQKRGYINLVDVINYIFHHANNPPPPESLMIHNQITETFSVNEVAELIKRETKKYGKLVKINHIKNPRKEAEEHHYNPSYSTPPNVEKATLLRESIDPIFRIVAGNMERVDVKKFL